jgi:hypothetical protein
MEKEIAVKELKFCLKLWKEKAECYFGGNTKCENCAAPYVLLKMITNETLHDKKMTRLTLQDWEEKIKEL